jgi:6-phosphogluconolactonase (cycloisomerase 2 family)/uncharacterized protein YjdB
MNLGEREMKNRAAIFTTLFILAAAVSSLRATMVVKPPAGPMRIQVVPGNATVVAGNTQSMAAYLESFRGYQQQQAYRLVSATWSSSNTNIATVDPASGLVTGVAKGTVVITAKSGPFSGRAVIVVTPPLTSITVTPANPTIPEGTTQQFTATGNYNDGSSGDLTGQVTWASTDISIATIVPGGLATAANFKTGATTIQATFDPGTGPVTGSTSLTVSPAVLTSISVSPQNPQVPKGTPQPFTATGFYTNGTSAPITNSVTWSSSDMTKATIDNTGLASTLAQGSTTIGATLSGKTDSTTLTIGPAAVTMVQVTPSNAGTIPLGSTLQFQATAYFTDLTNQDVTSNGGTNWTSNNQAVASVNATGLATGASQGNNVQITATFGGVSGSGTISVGPPALKSIAVTPSPVTIPNGLTQQFTATGTYTDNSTQDLTNSASWSSGSPSAASVNSTGLAKCLEVGDGDSIRATANAITGSATLNCALPNLTSITVTPANSTIAKGTTQNMVATGHYSDNTTQDLTGFASWSSSNSGIASIVSIQFDPNNGKATGNTQGGPVTITATYNGVSGNTNLTVGPPNLVSIAVTPVNPLVNKGNTQQFTATGTYTDNSAQNITNTAAWSSSATGTATINASTGLATAVAIGTTTITATQNAISGNTNMRVIGPPARFAYTANFLDGTIEEYTVNANGQLRNNGYVFNGASTGPQSVTIDPGNNYVYVSNNNVNTVSGYSITANGTLAPIPGSPFTAGNGPNMLAFSVRGNGGRSAYVANITDNTISEFTVNGNGSLTGLGTVSGGAGVSVISVAVAPNGLYAYVTNQGAAAGAGNIAQYSIAQNNGALSALNPATVTAPGFPEAIVVDPFSRFVFISDVTTTVAGGHVSAYKINNDGTLAFQNTLGAGKGTIALAVDPSGHFLYTANYASNSVSAFTINQSSGALTAVVGTPNVAVGSSPQAVSVDSSGQYLYVGHFSSHEVWEYNIDGTTGALTFVRKMRSGEGVDGMAVSSGSSAPAYTDFLAFDVSSAGMGEALVDGGSGALTAFSNNTPAAPGAVALDPHSRFVYAINSGNNTIAEYSVGAFGSLTFNGTVAVANAPYGVTIDSSGRFLYVIGINTVYGYTINQSTGLLTAMSGGASLATIAIASSVTVDPTGRFLIVGAVGPAEIYVFSINPSTGIPTNVTGSPFSSVLGDNVAVDPTGQFLYVVGGNHTGSFYIRTYSISASTGALTLVDTLNPSSFATGVAVEPYGRYAYVCLGGGVVNAYTIDPSTGRLTSVGSLATGNSPNSVAVDIQGQYVYVTNNSSNTISGYSINQNTGAVTEITGAGSPFAAGTSPGSVVIGGVIQ